MRIRHVITIAAAAVTIMMLTACTSTKNTQVQNAVPNTSDQTSQTVTGTQSTNQTVTGTQSTNNGGSNSSAATTPDESVQIVTGTPIINNIDQTIPMGDTTAQNTTLSNQSAGTTQEQIQVIPEATDTTVSTAPDSIEDSMADPAVNDTDEEGTSDQSVEIPVIPTDTGTAPSDEAVEHIPGEFDGVDQTMEDVWTGTYKAEEETVVLTKIDDKTLTFAFEQSGICGQAEIKDGIAIFNGEDQHVIEFVINQDQLTVNIHSEEDFDTSESPLNGTYTKQP